MPPNLSRFRGRLLSWATLAIVTGCAGCARPGSGDDTAASQGGRERVDSPAVGRVDSAAVPVIITLRHDSLGLTVGESPQQVAAKMEATFPRLRRVVEFDVLAISPAIYAVNVKPRAPMTPSQLVAALRTHPLVASVELSGIVRVP